jgi:hypothetical protein
MKPLELRKQLLLAESELNRAQLSENLVALRAEVRALTTRATSFRSIASSVAMLVAGLTTFRRNKPEDAMAKTSWWRIILKGAGLISTLWLAVRWQGRDRDKI